MDLLQQALAEAKGTPSVEAVEPEINLRIPALIPDSYIDDIRVRLGFYRKLSDIESERDLDRIEEEMVDRFGQVPDVVTNLFGLMMIRKMCRDLAVRDISAGPKNVSLAFTDSTPARPEKLIQLAVRSPEKYQVTPDSRLVIKVTGSNWPAVLEELKYIRNQIL
jgi:transcription-repair coupling factor (superfamily II helicase)